jgi:hypothetical protein
MPTGPIIWLRAPVSAIDGPIALNPWGNGDWAACALPGDGGGVNELAPPSGVFPAAKWAIGASFMGGKGLSAGS